MGVRWCTTLIRGESREVWIFSPTASCWTTLWKTILFCCPWQLASWAFGFPKLLSQTSKGNISEENLKVDFNLRYSDFFLWFSKSFVIQLVSLVHNCNIFISNIFDLFTWHLHLYHTSNWTVIENKVSIFSPYSSSWCRCLLCLKLSNKNFPFPCTHNMK